LEKICQGLGLQFYISLLVINIYVVSSLQAQDLSPDSRLTPQEQINQKLTALKVLFERSELDSVDELGNQIIESAKFHDQKEAILQAQYQIALLYNRQSKFSKSDSLFDIADNGDGIDEGKLEYIFKPFKTLQSKSLSQSSGLGLSICKNILDRFNGEIWVDSKVGVGSTFYFSIPKVLKNV